MQNILLVEDHPDLANLMAKVLEEEGYKVRATLKSGHALAFCEDHTPDLIISDMFANEEGTLDFVQQIRSHTELQNTPFVFLTDSAEIGEEEKAGEINAAAYLTKPFDLNALLTTVHQILPRK